MSTLPRAEYNELVARIRGQADADHVEWAQYRNHWDGPEWTLIRFTHKIETKLGVAFEPGDITLARYGYFVGSGTTAYSFRNKIDTGVLGGYERIEIETCGVPDLSISPSFVCKRDPGHDGPHINGTWDWEVAA